MDSVTTRPLKINQSSDPHNFESHAMAYERLLRLANDLAIERPTVGEEGDR